MTERENRTRTLRNDPPSADEDVARLRLRLRHRSLIELEHEGLLEWDREEHVVRKGPEFDSGRLERE